MKPMPPIHRIDSSANEHERFSSRAQSSVGIDGGEQDDDPAHRRRAPLALVAGRPLGADHLAHLARPQPRDDPGTRRRTR